MVRWLTIGTTGGHATTLALTDEDASQYMALIREAMNTPMPVGKLDLKPDDDTELLIGLRDVVLAECSKNPPEKRGG